MHALNQTMFPQSSRARAEAQLRQDDPEFARITEFAKRILATDQADLILADTFRRPRTAAQMLCRTALEVDASVSVPDLRKDARFKALGDGAGLPGGALAVPVCNAIGKRIGALCVQSVMPRVWSSDELETLTFLAVEIGATLRLQDAARLQERRADEQSLVAREYHHRIRNAFSVSSAVVVLSGARQGSVQDLIETTSAQLAALADAHSSLGFGEDAVDLKALVSGSLQAYNFSDASVSVAGCAAVIPENKVVSLALILNELATNSTKHGALREGGSVDVSWTMADGEISLVWSETSAGDGPSDAERTGSFGGTMVELSVSQLNAKLERDWRTDGLDVSLRFGA